MALEKVALDGTFVRLEPLEERHRAAIRPAAQHPEIFTVTTSALGPLFDPYIDNALKRSDGQHELAFVVMHKALGHPVGMTRYLNIEENHRKLEIGSTWYEPAVWGGPVDPECKFLLMRHAFETLKFNRVEYKTDARNVRSRAAILKLGATQEGIFRKHMIMADGHVRDSVYFSIIDSDWPVVKAGLEKRLAAPPR
jgi:N-acetyltransferase